MYTDLEGLGIPRRKGSGIGGLQVVGQVMMTMIMMMIMMIMTGDEASRGWDS